MKYFQGKKQMVFKFFLFLLPLVFVGCGEPRPKMKNITVSTEVKTQIIWNSDSKSYISDSEYNKAMLKYVESKYPKKVTKTIDGLMWQDNYESKSITRDWYGAKKYCSNLSLVGYSDWRLPNIDELKNLYKKKDKLKNFTSNGYWSSTTNASYTSYAWGVYFDYGYSHNYYKANSDYVRCVRAGQ